MEDYSFDLIDSYSEEFIEGQVNHYLLSYVFSVELNPDMLSGTLSTDREIEPSDLEELQGVPIFESGPFLRE